MNKPPFLPSAVLALIGVSMIGVIAFNPPQDEASSLIGLGIIAIGLCVGLSGVLGMALAKARPKP